MINTVSSYTFVRVLFLQIGHGTHKESNPVSSIIITSVEFALRLPSGYEHHLNEFDIQLHHFIRNCDNYVVTSNTL